MERFPHYRDRYGQRTTIRTDVFIPKPCTNSQVNLNRGEPSRISYIDTDQKRSQIEAYFGYINPLLEGYRKRAEDTKKKG